MGVLTFCCLMLTRRRRTRHKREEERERKTEEGKETKRQEIFIRTMYEVLSFYSCRKEV